MEHTNQIIVTFEKERETKNAIRYQEIGGEFIGTIYVKKDTLVAIGTPDRIIVRIEAA